VSSPSNQYAYSNEFVGNLLEQDEPVAMRVYTRLCIMTNEASRELKGRCPSGSTMEYVFHRDENLPMHPSLLAMGRHYFTW
jgi:hypothetical protein